MESFPASFRSIVFALCAMILALFSPHASAAPPSEIVQHVEVSSASPIALVAPAPPGTIAVEIRNLMQSYRFKVAAENLDAGMVPAHSVDATVLHLLEHSSGSPIWSLGIGTQPAAPPLSGFDGLADGSGPSGYTVAGGGASYEPWAWEAWGEPSAFACEDEPGLHQIGYSETWTGGIPWELWPGAWQASYAHRGRLSFDLVYHVDEAG